MWYLRIMEFLMQSGYSVAPTNSNLFLKAEDGKLVVILIYVDDLIIAGDDLKVICQIRANLLVL